MSIDVDEHEQADFSMVPFHDIEEDMHLNMTRHTSNVHVHQHHDCGSSDHNDDDNGTRGCLRRVEPSDSSLTPPSKTRSLGSMSPRVSFGSIEVRDYPLELGDHPECSRGPPVTLSWQHLNSRTMEIEDYEASISSSKGRRLRMTQYERTHMLKYVAGYEKEDLDKAEKEVQRVKHNRMRTNRRKRFQKFDEMLESAQRKLKNALKKGPERTARENEPRRKSDGHIDMHSSISPPDRVSAPAICYGAMTY